MFNALITLMRRTAPAAEDAVATPSALLILAQQHRAAAGIERSKRALAAAIAQDKPEGRRLVTPLKRIADLEGRATAAASIAACLSQERQIQTTLES